MMAPFWHRFRMSMRLWLIGSGMALAPVVSQGAHWDLPLEAADRSTVEQDLERILRHDKAPDVRLQIGKIQASVNSNTVSVRCEGADVFLDVRALSSEWSSTFFLGLRKLGFLFPHPRIQVNPSLKRVMGECGKTFTWRPRLKYRGFHLHTMHPNEWMHGFLMGKGDIAEETVRWMARNGQNVLQAVLLRTLKRDDLAKHLRKPYALAKSFGMLRSVNASFEQTQQKSYRLVPPVAVLQSRKGQLLKSIRKLRESIDFDILACSMGSTEFTSGSFEENIDWMDAADDDLRKHGKRLFITSHVSSNQNDPKYGNFNFLPQYASPTVGIQPHTVMFYALEDVPAPVYGRSDFKDMIEYAVKESRKRPTWYFPETSYWVSMDIDIPIYLTDYLIARSRDMDLLERTGINGQVVFSSGHEIGYWLIDWTVALLNDSEHTDRPMIGLELLGEDRATWARIIDFQNRHIKLNGLLPMLASTVPTDEMPKPLKHKTHERFTLKELAKNPAQLAIEIAKLEAAVAETPDTFGIRNEELRTLLDITHLRISNALAIRKGLLYEKDKKKRREMTDLAKALRLEAQPLVDRIIAQHNRYPEALVFERHKNPSSYHFGYGWPASKLHFWEREEEMVRRWEFSPFFMNIYNLLRIIM